MPVQTTDSNMNANKPKQTLGWVAFGFFVTFIVAGGLIFYLFYPADGIAKLLKNIALFCHCVPCFIGLGMLAVMWLLYGLMSGNADPLELMRGADNKFSISKGQFLLWTVLVFFSYTSIVAALIGQHALPPNLLLAMGLSVTTVLAAKKIKCQIKCQAYSRRKWFKTLRCNASDGSLRFHPWCAQTVAVIHAGSPIIFIQSKPSASPTAATPALLSDLNHPDSPPL